MPSTYESITDNLNMRKTLTLEEIVHALQTKKTKLNDLGSIKEQNANFATHRYWGEWRGQKGARACTVLQTANEGYTVQGYSLYLTINCYHYKKKSNGWRDCTLYLSMNERKRWITNDKDK